MDARRQVGLRVRKLRASRQMSQEELAHEAAIHVTYLSGLENGKRNPSLLVLSRVADALNVELLALFQID